MTSLSLLLWILFAIALQVGLFLGIGYWRHWQAFRQLKQGGPAPEGHEVPSSTLVPHGGAWPGWRTFKVARREWEDARHDICSFYLEPLNQEGLTPFRPGQFLTFRLEIPAPEGPGTEAVTRCYSLSDQAHPGHYRITVKRVPSPPGSNYPVGRSSNYLHEHAQVGTNLQVRAPSGHFYLEPGTEPVVLIAGGIGVTPLLSMLQWCQAHAPERELWFFYGVRNSEEAAFASQLNAIAAANSRVRLHLCLSQPLPGDLDKGLFHHSGRVDVNLLRMHLPLRPYHYYLCGPAPMLESLVPELEAWGVPTSSIHYEAFGPASITRKQTGPEPAPSSHHMPGTGITVTFSKSGKQVPWTAESANLLAFAEAQGIAIDSGCRAGACGSCQTRILSGQVSYPHTTDYDADPGTGLMCVCTPTTDLTLEA
jgi:ferredoxin-NADP reductase